jgi:hypothetical protein
MRLVCAALILLALTTVPLFIVGLLDPTSNPIGLGLLFVLGAPVALGLLVLAALRAIWQKLHPRANR